MPMGIGPIEMIVVLVMGVLLIGFPVGVVLLVLYLVRNQNSSRLAELEAENRRLRKQLGEAPTEKNS